MKDSKTSQKLDDDLFDIVYKELKWDTNCNCPYYKEWCNKISGKVYDSQKK